MKIDGIEIPDDAKCEIRGSSGDVGPFSAAYAYFYVRNGNDRPDIYAVTEISSGLKPNQKIGLLKEEFSVELREEGNGDEKGGVLVRVTSGHFAGEPLHLKIAKIQFEEEKEKLSHEEIICRLKDNARMLIAKIKKESAEN